MIATMCIKFRQYLVLFSLLVGIGSIAMSGQKIILAKKVVKRTRGRSIASYIPSDDVEAVPIKIESWAKDIFAKDRAGVRDNIQATFAFWRNREECAQKWNLESTGNYEVPGTDYRQAYFQRQLLRYLDKRVSGGLKRAKEGSTLERIAQVQNALRPNTTAKISKNIKLKFKVRVLRGRVIMRVDNPWVDYSTEFSLTGDINMSINKKIDWADVTARVNFQPLEKSYYAELDKPVAKNIIARYSARQPAASDIMDNRLQLLFNKGF
jgi:hypothetical protein